MFEFSGSGPIQPRRAVRRFSGPTGVSAGTINKELGFVRRVLILAARKWRHPNGTRYALEDYGLPVPVDHLDTLLVAV
jgi:hypothetical protein